jgi:hypothetical protein
LIWKQLSIQPTVGLPLTTFVPGTLVNVQKDCGLWSYYNSAITNNNSTCRRRENYQSRVVIEVDEVISAGYKPALHKIPLHQMGSPPFSLIVAKSMLSTPNSSPPAVTPVMSTDSCALPDDIAMYSPLQILHPDNLEQINQNITRSSDLETDDDGDNDDDNNQHNGSKFSELDIEELVQERNATQQSIASEASTTSPSSTFNSEINPTVPSLSFLRHNMGIPTGSRYLYMQMEVLNLKQNLQVIMQITCEHLQIPVDIPVSHRCKYDILIIFSGEPPGIHKVPCTCHLCGNCGNI